MAPSKPWISGVIGCAAIAILRCRKMKTSPLFAPIRFAFVALALLAPHLARAQDLLTRVSLTTSLGVIVLELDRVHAPATVQSFLRYVMDGHFDNTLFYRVVPRFVIQAGSVGPDGNGRPVHDSSPLEANNGLSNKRGAVALARDDEPNSATAEFFIDLVDNPGLDRRADDTENKTGFTVFGHVLDGMNVVDAIAAVPLGGGQGPFPNAAPLTPVVIQKAVVLP